MENTMVVTVEDERVAREITDKIRLGEPIQAGELTNEVTNLLASRALLDASFADILLDEQEPSLPEPAIYSAAKACGAAYMISNGLITKGAGMKDKYLSCFQDDDSHMVYNMLAVRVLGSPALARDMQEYGLDELIPDEKLRPQFAQYIEKSLETGMSIEERYTTLLLKYQKLQNDYTTLFEQFQELYRQNQLLQERVDTLNNTVDELHDDVSDMKTVLKELAPEYFSAKREAKQVKREVEHMEETYPRLKKLDTFETRKAAIMLTDLNKEPAGEGTPKYYENLFLQRMKYFMQENKDNPKYRGYVLSAAAEFLHNGISTEGVKTLINRYAPQAVTMKEGEYANFVISKLGQERKQDFSL